MAKVVVWNLERFGINKINDPRNQRAPNTGGNTYNMASYYRRILVNRVINTDPDIIIIIETASGDNVLSDLATQTGGMNGCIYILNYLRNTPGPVQSATWRLVPPLRIGRGGKAETVAVFYRGQSTVGGSVVNRYFTGPNIWTGGYNGFSVEPGTAAAAAYPSPPPMGAALDINAMIVPPGTVARTIPVAALHNGGVAENRVAARNEFRDFDNGNPGDVLDFSTLREPYMATFTEVNALGNVRDLTFFGVHAPAVVGDQGAFMNVLTTMFDVISPLGPNETRIIGGDFNLNLLNPNGTLSTAYVPLTNNGYTLLLAPAGAPPGNVNPYRGYFATHMKGPDLTAGSLFLWSQNNNPTQSFYPSYGYIGSEFVQNFYSIDNILVRPFNGGHNYQTTILNFVTGSPFNSVALPPGNPPIGTIPFVQSFAVLPWPPSPTAPNWAVGRARSLTGWSNYGHIYRTSDHLAIYANI